MLDVYPAPEMSLATVLWAVMFGLSVCLFSITAFTPAFQDFPLYYIG
jgi:hypothetical protein